MHHKHWGRPVLLPFQRLPDVPVLDELESTRGVEREALQL